MRRSGPTFMAPSSSRYSTHRSSMVCRVSAAMIGATSTVCAMTMACGVNKSPKEPSGPERDNSRKIAKPTTTGGNPIIAFSATIAPSRPGKRVSAIIAPNGTPISAAKNTALRLTISDSSTMAISAGSAVMTRCNAEASSDIGCRRIQGFRIVCALAAARKQSSQLMFQAANNMARSSVILRGRRLRCALGIVHSLRLYVCRSRDLRASRARLEIQSARFVGAGEEGWPSG